MQTTAILCTILYINLYLSSSSL